MHLKLFFKDVDGEAVPYLWNDEIGENPQEGDSHRLATSDDFDFLSSEYKNCCREIKIVESLAAAKAMALISQSESRGMSIITRIDYCAWAVGTVLRDGNYDSGLPAIIDTRERGPVMTLDASRELIGQISYKLLILEAEPQAELINPVPEPEPSIF